MFMVLLFLQQTRFFFFQRNLNILETAFLDLKLSKNGIDSTKICEKRDVFDFDIINFSFLDGDVPRRLSYGVNI